MNTWTRMSMSPLNTRTTTYLHHPHRSRYFWSKRGLFTTRFKSSVMTSFQNLVCPTKTDAVVPPSGTGVTWMVDSGPTPTDEMLQYEWPRGWHTTGYIFYPKGGRAKLKGYQWIYLSESMHEIEARAKETIESAPDDETLKLLKPIMEEYEQFGFRCKKRGFKRAGLCYTRPCETMLANSLHVEQKRYRNNLQ